MGNVHEQISRLLAKRAELDARLATARSTATRQERRDETRRKIIAGAMVLKQHGGDWRRVGDQLRFEKMLEPRDYALFYGVNSPSSQQAEDKPADWREFIRPSSDNA